MNFNIASIKNIEIPVSVINETENFLRQKGRQGYEAKVYWIGTNITNEKTTIKRIFIPKQIAKKSILGVSVEVPDEGNFELIRNLKNNEFAVVKLHTHPREAYLSKTDIVNPFFRHEGAISIVIPNFCAKPLKQMEYWCINIFKNGNWVKLEKSQINNLFLIKE